ncbi:chitobiosyldiphosphodolichol beta-mannosyltransferase [Calycina marina]|uniref:Chitobiosyldiphosphodolichol beta-mannosyltransferase n=1 Tax=Calycina marina TaxID=1763456 RepID=A0A9P8CHS0_9HELO|nr:chitobiosyldiphosphodolichol beta-mannosyltransferase [Calycina marina]
MSFSRRFLPEETLDANAQVFSFVLLLLAVYFLRPVRYKPAITTEGSQDDISVQVVVLGDIGRSPRMQYHAISISRLPGRVDLVGYNESAVHPDVASNSRITTVPLPIPPLILRSRKLPFVVVGPLKALWQALTLLYTLAYTTKPAKWMLVQNPPSIPTLLLAIFVCYLRGTQLIVDWHNYGWSILASTRGPKHLFVKISKLYETLLGRWGPTLSLTVTDAMKTQLRNKPYGYKNMLAVHDRPSSLFQPLTDEKARLSFLQRIPETAEAAADILDGKTRLLISSTSWTPDEDFSLLLDGLCSYSASSKTLPPILAIITGKGPQKQMYLDRINTLASTGRLRNVKISTAWLSMEDYATLLACADLGVCLHMSSSGVDLPMKVVDMFGAGLPVVGYGSYASWSELVTDGVNGRSFETPKDLALALETLFSENDGRQLAKLRSGAMKEGSRRWDDEWQPVETILRLWDTMEIELRSLLNTLPPEELKKELHQISLSRNKKDNGDVASSQVGANSTTRSRNIQRQS